jgi:hypothetical protein
MNKLPAALLAAVFAAGTYAATAPAPSTTPAPAPAAEAAKAPTATPPVKKSTHRHRHHHKKAAHKVEQKSTSDKAATKAPA